MIHPHRSICAIIPTYNREDFIRECIDSVLAQSRPIKEILVINDGSTDKTEEIVRSYGSHVRLVNKSNGGKASALNLALAQAEAEYIWICDDDDVAAPDGLQYLANALDRDDSIGFSYGDYQTFSDQAGVRRYAPPSYHPRPEEPGLLINLLEGMFLRQYAMLVRASLYRQAGPFREDLRRAQDYDMTLRLARRARAAYVPQVIFFQRDHAGLRGVAGERFHAMQSNPHQLKYDHAVFSYAKDECSLPDFMPHFAADWEGARATRAALTGRACILAKHAHWGDAAASFRQAGETGSYAPSKEEQQLAGTIMASANPSTWDWLADSPQHMRQLHDCYRACAYGRDILHSACRPLVWQMRRCAQAGQFRAAARRWRILVSILGIRGTARRLLESLTT